MWGDFGGRGRSCHPGVFCEKVFDWGIFCMCVTDPEGVTGQSRRMEVQVESRSLYVESATMTSESVLVYRHLSATEPRKSAAYTS